jgi:hypothetical protein
MTFFDKMRLYWQLGRSFFPVIIFGSIALYSWKFLENSEQYPSVIELLTGLLVIFSISIIVLVWLKFRRAMAALKRGVRQSAKVLKVAEHSDPDDGPKLFVLTWIDPEGFTGNSLPRKLHYFERYERGDVIWIYKNDGFDSWWEKDLLGMKYI